MFDTILPWLSHQVANNDIFAGVIGGSALATLALAVRTIAIRVYYLTLLNFSCKLTITNDDEAYVWINEWLAQHSYAKRVSRLQLNSREVHDDSHDFSKQHAWTLAPGTGSHFFFYRGRLIHLSRETSTSGGANTQKTREIITIRIFARGQQRVRDLVSEAQNKLTDESTINVFCYNHFWRKVAKRRVRALDTVVMPSGFIENLVADAAWFFQSSAWYHERGIPYRRGYLLSGPPGCGKTSLVFAMASHFKLPLYLLNLGSIKEDSDLFDAISGVPERAILLIEDVDANGAVKNRGKARKPKKAGAPAVPGEEEKSPITMSAFLNALDGVMSKDGRLLVMTTNHPERLDPAVIRPGRVDRHETIGPMDAAEVSRMFLRFFPMEIEVSQKIAAGKYSAPAAKLQGVFLNHQDDPAAAFKALAKMKTRK